MEVEAGEMIFPVWLSLVYIGFNSKNLFSVINSPDILRGAPWGKQRPSSPKTQSEWSLELPLLSIDALELHQLLDLHMNVQIGRVVQEVTD